MSSMIDGFAESNEPDNLEISVDTGLYLKFIS